MDFKIVKNVTNAGKHFDQGSAFIEVLCGCIPAFNGCKADDNEKSDAVKMNCFTLHGNIISCVRVEKLSMYSRDSV